MLRNPSARYILAKGTPKSSCPQCGARRFRRYLDTTTGDLLDDRIGVCDRENNCGYLFTPMDYIREQGGFAPRAKSLPPPEPVRDDWRVPPGKLEKTQGFDRPNTLLQFLCDHKDEETIKMVWSEYKVGTFPKAKESERWEGATVYWLINAAGEVMNGKLMHYTGWNRDKSHQPTWISRLLTGKSSKDIGAAQCLFGEHLLTEYPDANVAVVESEKTALVGRYFYPDVVWVATGGSGNMSGRKMIPLSGRRVWIFPDAGTGYTEWCKLAEQYEPLFESMVLSSVCEDIATDKEKEDGLDISDFLMEGRVTEDLFVVTPVLQTEVLRPTFTRDQGILDGMTTKEINAIPLVIVPGPPLDHFAPKAPVIDKLIDINPAIKTLIKDLDLDTDNITIS